MNEKKRNELWQIRFYWFELAATHENVYSLTLENNQGQG